MTPTEFLSCNTLLGGTATGMPFIDVILRPFFRLGMKCPIALISIVVLFYAMIAYMIVKSAYFKNQDEGYGYYND